jgi:chromate reductase, NAD(P)H dehydrogenase (quinone)
MKLLALSGSLRAASINSAFCRALEKRAPPQVQVLPYDGLGGLPLFNPDLEAAPPSAVNAFRTSVQRADALIIASPEYAHGISGVMKNALDWLVSFEGAVGKPVALVNTSPRSHHAHDALAEVLRTMSLDIVAGASISLALQGYCASEAAMLASPQVCEGMDRILGELSSHRGALTGNDDGHQNRFR